jgi:peptide chain release factor 1
VAETAALNPGASFNRPEPAPGRQPDPARSRSTPSTSKVHPVIEQLVEQIRARFAELEAMMSDPAVIADRARYAEVGREYRQLKTARDLAEEYATLKDDLEGARELLAEGEDEELRKVVEEAPPRIAALEEEIRLAMVEQDPNDDKNVIVEIRAGTGGDEAALFAGDLYKMLTRYAELRGFSTDVLSQSASEAGGFKEVTFEVRGDGAYSVFKFEGGTHRVQRVPETESQGRIHTSTATIAVLPEAEEVDVQVDQNDLQIDVYRSSGPGGQSVNTTDSAVRITHKPTGIVVSMQDEKSQLQNRDKAMRVLRARLLEKQIAEQQAAIASERKAQVGSGERAEKVRTYNFPQGRITDHRIKHTSHNLDGVLNGEIEEFTNALAAEEKRRRLEDAAEG